MQRDRLPMFGLKSKYLRRRLSAPTSGSAKRRALERKRAQQIRAEGELLARRRREQRLKDKYEQQRQAREELASYEPWGRGGGGAPNPRGNRYRNLRAGEIYPEDELKVGSPFDANLRNISPRRRRRAPFGLHEDPEVCYAEGLRNYVDNDIRYRQTPDQQKSYKQILDGMVCRRKDDNKQEAKEDLKQENKLQAMVSPWGKPGPGGTTWRNPRDIGLNFSKSMGWTDNDIFNKIKVDHKRYKRSSLTLPKVKKDDDSPIKEREKMKPSSIEKLPDINAKSNSDEEVTTEKVAKKEEVVIQNENAKHKIRKKDKFVKRLSNGERVTRIPFDGEFRDGKDDDATIVGEKKPTPEAAILRLTGGIELVPLLARQRRVGPRTLPSSDVTRAPEENCQWRELLNNEYLTELKSQMQVKFHQQEESRRESAESSMMHHKTWASLWGRPGHGAPQRGRYARNNLSRLLYFPLQPLAPIPPAI